MSNLEKNKVKKSSVKLSPDDQNLLGKYNKFRIKSDTEVPEEEYVFNVGGVGCMPIGDLSAVKAEPKMGKTTVLKKIIATVLNGELGQLSSNLKDPVVMWADTEQKIADAKRIIQDVKKMTGLSYSHIDRHLLVFSLRKTDCKILLDELKVGVKAYRPDIVVIDGIAEFVDSVNDEVKAKDLIRQLMACSEKHHCAIICVLHENRAGNRDMKGHLGAQLTQKAAMVIECKKSGDTITVRCTDSRHQSTPEWSIRYDENDNIVDADGNSSPLSKNARPSKKPNKKQLADAQKKKDRTDFCLTIIKEHRGSIPKKELIEELEKGKSMSRTNASSFLTTLINVDRVICESNKIISVPLSETEAS